MKQQTNISANDSVVVLSERSESKELRTNAGVGVTLSAKILRLHSAALHFAQDDTTVGLWDQTFCGLQAIV